MLRARSRQLRPIACLSMAKSLAAAITLLAIAGESGAQPWPRGAQGSTIATLFASQGQSQALSGGPLYLMRARWYHPTSGRFVSRDPIRSTDPVRINPYQAFFGDPIAFVDPMGTDPTSAEELLKQLDIQLADAQRLLDKARIMQEDAAARGDEKSSRLFLENAIPSLERQVEALQAAAGRVAQAAAIEAAARLREEQEAAKYRNEELGRRAEMRAGSANSYEPATDLDLFPQLSRWFGLSKDDWVVPPPANGQGIPAADPQDLTEQFEKTLREVFANDDLSRMIGPSPFGMPQTAREAGASDPVPSEPTCPSEEID